MQTKKIKEFAKVRRGASPRPIDDPKYFGGDVGWVRISDVTASRKCLRSTTQYVSKLGESFSVRVDKGDLVISIAGTVGRPIIIDTPACIHDGFVQIYDFKKSDVEFLYYYLQFLEKRLIRYGQSGTQTNLNIDIVNNIELNCFGKEIERKIASIIGTADSAIEQTEMLIAKYLNIKTGLLQDLLTKGIDNKGNIRCKTTHKFIVKNGVEVPQEWEVLELGNCVDVFTGFPFESKYFSEEGIKLVRGDNVSKGFLRWGDKTKFWDKVGREHQPYFLKAGDILLSMDGSLVGRNYLVVKESDLPLLLVQRVARLRSENLIHSFLYFQIANEKFHAHVDLVKTGTSIPHISKSQIEEYKLVVPKISEQKQIIERMNSIVDLIQKERECLQKLYSIKTALMQDLFSGKVRITK